MLSKITPRCSSCLFRHAQFKQWNNNLPRQFSNFVSTKDLQHHPVTMGLANIEITSINDDSICVNNIYVTQSVLLFPKSFYLWNARTVDDINLSSLALIPVLFPTLEMLIIGCGKSTLDMIPAADLMDDFRAKGIVLEFMSSHHAVTTFNVLNAEDRHVGAAILLSSPPPIVSEDDQEFLKQITGDK
jgi:uncharacterized protein